jgi:hydrogenase expression/formation protein HypC
MCLAVPGRIDSTTDNSDSLLRVGRVNFSGVTKEVSLACVPDATIGDYVLVHAGIAITRIDEHEATEMLAYLERITEFAASPGEEL